MRHIVIAHRVTGCRRSAFQVKGQLSEPGRGSKVSMQTPSAVSPTGWEGETVRHQENCFQKESKQFSH